MAELIHQQRRTVAGSGGCEYDVLIFAKQIDGVWEGRLEFRPRRGGLVLCTGAETRQPSRDALARWALALAPADLEGAFERAFDKASQ